MSVRRIHNGATWAEVTGPTTCTYHNGTAWVPLYAPATVTDPVQPEPTDLVALSRSYGIPEGATGFEHVGWKRHGVTLTPHTGDLTITGSEARDAEGWITRERLDIDGRFVVASGVEKVRLRLSRIADTGSNRVETKGSNKDILIQDCEIDGLSSGAQVAVGGSNLTLERVHIHHIVDGIRWSWNCKLIDSLICDHVEDPRYHNDGLQSGSSNGSDPNSTSYNLALRTTFLNINTGLGPANTNPAQFTPGNAPVILKSDTGPIQNCFFDGCFFDGGNFLYVSNPATDFATGLKNPITGIKFRNCTFGNRYNQKGGYGNVAGPDNSTEQGIITGWSNNRVINTLDRSYAVLPAFQWLQYKLSGGAVMLQRTPAQLEARFAPWDGSLPTTA